MKRPVKLVAGCILAFSLALPQYTCSKYRGPNGQVVSTVPSEAAGGAAGYQPFKEPHYALENFLMTDITKWLTLIAFIWPLVVFGYRVRVRRGHLLPVLWWSEPFLLAGSTGVVTAVSSIGDRAIGAYVAYSSLALYAVAWLFELRTQWSPPPEADSEAIELQTPLKRMHLALTLIGMFGIVALFLPFAFDRFPLRELLNRQESWMIAGPGLLAISISAASFRWVFAGSLSRPEKWIAYILAGAAALSTAFLFSQPNRTDWGAVIPIVIAQLPAALATIKAARTMRGTGFRPVMAMQAAYLSNSCICLGALFIHWQIGAYWVLAASAAYWLQIVVIAEGPRLGSNNQPV